jgi:hypothetical protein
MRILRDGPWLVARLPGPHRVASWAVVGGGIRDAGTVAWLHVGETELGPDLDPARYGPPRRAWERGARGDRPVDRDRADDGTGHPARRVPAARGRGRRRPPASW